MNRKGLLLILTLGLCVAVTYAWFMVPRQERLSSSPPIVVKDKISVDEPMGATEPELDFSGSAPKKFKTPKRNIFGSIFDAPVPVRRKSFVPPKPKPLANIAPVSVQEQIMLPPPLKLKGYLHRDGDVMAFLSSAGGEIYLVREGDVFGEGMVVKEIGAKEMIVVSEQTGQEIILELARQRVQRIR